MHGYSDWFVDEFLVPADLFFSWFFGSYSSRLWFFSIDVGVGE